MNCVLYVKIESIDPTEELLTIIDANILEINENYMLNFVPVYNKNLNDSSFINNMVNNGITGLPCMLTYSGNKQIDCITGNKNIVNYLLKYSSLSGNKNGFYVEDGKIKSSGNISNEDELRSAMVDLINNQGEENEEKDNYKRDMERVKQIASSKGASDDRFRSIISRAKVKGVPFSETLKVRKDTSESGKNNARRGERITANRGTKIKKDIGINNNQNFIGGIAYRGSDTIRSVPLGKKEHVSVNQSIVNDNREAIESKIVEEAENDYDNFINLPEKKRKITGSQLISKMKSNRQVSA